MTVRVDPALRLPDELEAVVYRVAREALQNVAKHAQADVVVVSFEPDGDAAVLTVRDDGRGFDPADVPPAMSASGSWPTWLEEHGTDLTVESAPGEGTTVRLVVPA